MSDIVGLLGSGDRHTGGGGSTIEAIARDVLTGEVGFKIGVIICSNTREVVPGFYERFDKLNDEFGLKGEDRLEVVPIGPSTHPGGKQERGQTADESSAVCRTLEERGASFAWMAGYLRITTTEFLDTWCWKPEYAQAPGFEYRNGLYHPRALTGNDHPAILPFIADKWGHGAHEEAKRLYDEGKIKHTVMSWHLAAEKVDAGPMIDEDPVAINPTDSADNISDNVQSVEKARTAKVIAKHLILRGEHLRAAA